MNYNALLFDSVNPKLARDFMQEYKDKGYGKKSAQLAL
jgi:hypothetical protein